MLKRLYSHRSTGYKGTTHHIPDILGIGSDYCPCKAPSLTTSAVPDLLSSPPSLSRSQLRRSVCLALSKMCSNSELHYSMLEKACEDGDTPMAECLIELGADINKKTKTESLIYQVRQT